MYFSVFFLHLLRITVYNIHITYVMYDFLCIHVVSVVHIGIVVIQSHIQSHFIFIGYVLFRGSNEHFKRSYGFIYSNLSTSISIKCAVIVFNCVQYVGLLSYIQILAFTGKRRLVRTHQQQQ